MKAPLVRIYVVDSRTSLSRATRVGGKKQLNNCTVQAGTGRSSAGGRRHPFIGPRHWGMSLGLYVTAVDVEDSAQASGTRGTLGVFGSKLTR